MLREMGLFIWPMADNCWTRIWVSMLEVLRPHLRGASGFVDLGAVYASKPFGLGQR
jgi:hypothetical protein